MVRRLSGRRAECATPALGMDPNDDDVAFKTVKDVSREELERMAATPQQPLPATETLLFDKPEHIVPREARDLIPEDNQWGFRLNVP